MAIKVTYGENYNGDYIVLFTSNEGKTFMNYQQLNTVRSAVDSTVKVIFKIKNRKKCITDKI